MSTDFITHDFLLDSGFKHSTAESWTFNNHYFTGDWYMLDNLLMAKGSIGRISYYVPMINMKMSLDIKFSSEGHIETFLTYRKVFENESLKK